jgi:hypothetical protein
MIKKILPILCFMLLLMMSINSYGQTPPPPPPPPNGGPNAGHGAGGNQGIPSAPLGGGTELLIVLGAIYAGKQILNVRLKKSASLN